MPLTNRTICSLLFRPTGQGMYSCNSCSREYRSMHGFTNLMNHLHRFHPGYEAEAEEAVHTNNALRLHVVDARTTDIYRWLEWVVVERLPFTFVERRLVRQNARMSAITAKTITTYVKKLRGAVDQRVIEVLPNKVGVVLNGLTSGSRHYVAIFAVFDDGSRVVRDSGSDYFDDLDCSSRRFLLLAFSPLDKEEDLGAQSLFDLIADTLSHYEKPWESVLFMVGDNCSVNQYIGLCEGALPMIGCASHKFNLAMKDFLADDEPLLSRIHALMKCLSKLKCRAMLRKLTPLAPVMRNVTRWFSSFAMVERYYRLEPFLRALDHGTVAEYDLDSLLLSRRENERAFALREDLLKMEGVTKALQRSTLTLSGARRLFDHVVSEFPSLKSRLDPSAAIVNNPALESGIVKLQRQEPLTKPERAACAVFRLDGTPCNPSSTSETCNDDSNERPSFVRDALKRRRVSRRERYMDVAFIPPTSNECERFFSPVKLVFNDLRQSMEPAMLEAVMCLAVNRELWDVFTVDRIRQELDPNARD